MSAPRVSPAHEDYLEAIVELQEQQKADDTNTADGVRSVDIAAKLDVSKGSVTTALGVLKEAQLVEQPPYGNVTLTKEGRNYGEKVLNRHHALKGFLTDTLGVDPETAEQEACAMEHIISDSTMQKWIDYLDR